MSLTQAQAKARNARLLQKAEDIHDDDVLVVIKWPEWWNVDPHANASYYIGRIEADGSITIIVPLWQNASRVLDYINRPDKVRDYIANYQAEKNRPGPKDVAALKHESPSADTTHDRKARQSVAVREQQPEHATAGEQLAAAVEEGVRHDR